MTASVRTCWLVAWLGGAAIGVANGVAREATIVKRLPERTAHNVSTGTAIAAFTGYFRALDRRWPLPTAADALVVGGAWVAMTVGFESGSAAWWPSSRGRSSWPTTTWRAAARGRWC